MCVCIKSDQRKSGIKYWKYIFLRVKQNFIALSFLWDIGQRNEATFSIAKFYLFFFFKERKLQPNIFSHFYVKNCSSWIAEPRTCKQELHLLGNNRSLENLGPFLWSLLYLYKVCNRIGSQGQVNGSWAVEVWCYPLFLVFLGLWENLAERFLAQNSQSYILMISLKNIEIWY